MDLRPERTKVIFQDAVVAVIYFAAAAMLSISYDKTASDLTL